MVCIKAKYCKFFCFFKEGPELFLVGYFFTILAVGSKSWAQSRRPIMISNQAHGTPMRPIMRVYTSQEADLNFLWDSFGLPMTFVFPGDSHDLWTYYEVHLNFSRCIQALVRLIWTSNEFDLDFPKRGIYSKVPWSPLALQWRLNWPSDEIFWTFHESQL